MRDGGIAVRNGGIAVRLVHAELARLTARGFVRLMVALLLTAFAVTVATTWVNSHRPGQSEVTAALQRIDQNFYQEQERYSDCVYNRSASGSRPPEVDSDGLPPRDLGIDCEALLPSRGRLSDNLASVFVFAEQIRPLAYFLIVFLVLFGFLVGASSIGAELASGGLINLLLWHPRRSVVLAAKLGTLLGAVTLLSLLAGGGYLGALWLAARLGGLVGTPDGAFWDGLVGLLARGLVLVLLATAAGFGIATLGRHTAAALGVIAAYTVVWEGGIRVVMEISGFGGADQWMLSTYLIAWLRGGLELFGSGPCPDSGCRPATTIHATQALLVLLALAGGCVAAAFGTFRRRDLA